MSQAVMNRDVVDGAAVRGRGRLRALRAGLMLGGVAIVVVGAGYWWLSGGRWVSIDNAYTNADKVALSTDVSGEVADVPVHEGQVVRKGEVLFRLDPRQAEIAVQMAQADLAQTRLSLEAMKRDYQRMVQDIASKAALVQADEASFGRANALVGRGDVTRSAYDDARYKLLSDQKSLDSTSLAAEVQLARLDGKADVDVTTLPSYQQGASRLEEMRRQLDHMVVRAPFDGVVTQVSTLQPGMYLPAGTSAFGLISTKHVWVDANPKETELTHVKPGDRVEVRIDAYPGHLWEGVVESISPGSGAQFAILPAQNATGNWVKVVQRFPLRVRLEVNEGDPAIRAGMSVQAEIDTGHVRTLHELF